MIDVAHTRRLLDPDGYEAVTGTSFTTNCADEEWRSDLLTATFRKAADRREFAIAMVPVAVRAKVTMRSGKPRRVRLRRSYRPC